MRRYNRELWNKARGFLRTVRGGACGIAGCHKNARPVLQSGFRGSAGFTLIEIAIACQVIMLLTLIGFSETARVKEHARVAACLQYQASMLRSLWGDYALTGDFPNDLTAALNRLPACSIGNDFDYKGGIASGFFGEYYLRCAHNHSYVGVLFCDSGAYLPPKAIYNLAVARGNI